MSFNLSPIVPVFLPSQIGDRYVIDATAEEEVCSDAQLLVAVNESGRITGIQKHGRGGLNPDLTFEMIEVMHQRFFSNCFIPKSYT